MENDEDRERTNDNAEDPVGGGSPEDAARSHGVTIRIPRGLVVGALVLLLAVGGVGAYLAFRDTETCIDPGSGAEVGCEADGALSQADYDAQQAEEAEAEAAAEQERLEARARAEKCDRQVGGMMSDLRELNSRLAVGLSYDEYTNEVGDVQVSYDRVPFNRLEVDCLTDVGIDLESALNDYAKAAGAWGDCIEDFDCDMDSVDPQLQRWWSSAGSSIDDADSGLKDLATP